VETTNKIGLFLIFVTLSISVPISLGQVPYDFRTWADESRLFTIGRPEITNIYVQNLGTNNDSYIISYKKEAYLKNLAPASHLLYVSMPSNRIHSVSPGMTGNTFATINLLGPIARGNITFNVTSENSPSLYKEGTISISAGFPISLPEFELIGFLQLLVLVLSLLIVFYSSHFC
jgi:hypothetical protein